MNIKNEEKYLEVKKDTEGSTDYHAYGAAIIRYAEAWANLMEEKLKENSVLKVSDIAHQTSHDADTEGITGYMYGAAVSILSQFWDRGEELRLWHNKEYNSEYKGEGVINPAIVTIDIDDEED